MYIKFTQLIKAKMSYDLPSTSWRPRKDGGENRCPNLSSQGTSTTFICFFFY